MVLITYNDEIIDFVDRYKIVDEQGEQGLIKCYPNETDEFYYNGMVNRQSFEFFEDVVLPEDYYDGIDVETDEAIYFYKYINGEFVKITI